MNISRLGEGSPPPAPQDSTEKKKKLSEFKFEANISVFETEVLLKPMEGDEIGFRAKKGDSGIHIKKETLEKVFHLSDNVKEFFPNDTEIRTIVYNRVNKNVEFAMNATFDDDFILNKYSNVFALNSVALYVKPKSDKEVKEEKEKEEKGDDEDQ